MNKRNSIHQFLVFAKEGECKPIQTLSLKFIGGKVWLNTHNGKEITLRPTHIKRHYLAIGKDKKEYVLVQVDDKELKIKAQQEYCKRADIPNFAGDGYCFHCNKNTFVGPGSYTLSEASSQHITGCRHCLKSFCD